MNDHFFFFLFFLLRFPTPSALISTAFQTNSNTLKWQRDSRAARQQKSLEGFSVLFGVFAWTLPLTCLRAICRRETFLCTILMWICMSYAKCRDERNERTRPTTHGQNKKMPENSLAISNFCAFALQRISTVLLLLHALHLFIHIFLLLFWCCFRWCALCVEDSTTAQMNRE